MLRPTSLRALILFPLAAAFVLAVPSVRGQASAQQTALNNLLKAYAADEGATTANQLARTTLTASADDLVSAVYDLIQKSNFTNQQVADVVAGALLVDGSGKVRADKDKVAARILEAAIVAKGGQSDAALIGLLLPAVLNVNVSNSQPASKQLTVAGKEAVIAKALRSTSGLGATIAAQEEAVSQSAPGATPNAKRTAFALAVLKQLTYKPQVYDPAVASTSAATAATKGTLVQLNNGTAEPLVGEPAFNLNGVPPAIAGVRDYVDALLDTYGPALSDVPPAPTAANPKPISDRAKATYDLAEGVATNPAVAGAVFGGYVKDRLAAGGANATDTAIADLTHEAILRPKLAPDIADIVQNAFSQLATSTKNNFVGNLLAGSTAANKGKIASGAIRSSPTEATAIVNTVLTGGTPPANDVTQAGLAAFAAAAATGNGDPTAAADINKAVIAKLQVKPTPAADLTAVQAITTGIIKAIATANPDAAYDVARSLFVIQRSGVNPYSATAANGGNTVRAKLASDLAKGASTNYTAAGAAVAGVVKESVALDSVTADVDVTIAAAALKGAPKAAQSIAQKVSFFQDYKDGLGNTTASTFATKLALTTTAATAADIAAGVALTDTTHAGDIVKAVITSKVNNTDVTVQGLTITQTQRDSLNKAAFTIAGKAAVAVDVEAIGDIAQKVGTLLQTNTNPANKNLPKLSTLGTLATSLAKAINTKPQVSNHNRIDEMGELAAVLVTASLAVQGGNTPAALAAIGTSIYKAASAKLLANTGNNAADLSDIAGDVAGAIAQTIALAPATGPGSLTSAQKAALLGDTGTGSLIKLLSTAAKTFGSQVNGFAQSAFDQVRNTEVKILGVGTGQYGFVAGTEFVSNGTLSSGAAKFEIGAVVDPETRVKDL